MSKTTEKNQVLKKSFEHWSVSFENKLKQTRPFGLTDQNIADLLREVKEIFEVSVYPRNFQFDKIISGLVLELSYHCGLEVDDFPELSMENCNELSRMGKATAEETMRELHDEDNEVKGEDITEITKTVLGYEGEGPEPFVPKPEHLRHYGEGGFESK